MARGGKRPGAGRKKAPHTLEAEKVRAFIVATIAKNLKPLIEAMVERAKKGDVQAFKELMDRGLGRPMQAVELSGKEGGPIQIEGVEINVRR